MADQTFTSGQILTAAQMTTLQGNSGLVVVTPTGATGGTISGSTVTIGAGVSSVAVAGAFSSSFDAYKIVVSNGTPSADSVIRLILGSSVTGYYAARNGLTWSTGARSDGVDNNAAIWSAVGTSLTNGLSAEITLVNPGLAKYTTVGAFYSNITGSVNVSGLHQVATAFTGFTISPVSGTWTGGTVIVYGYRLS